MIQDTIWFDEAFLPGLPRYFTYRVIYLLLPDLQHVKELFEEEIRLL